MKHRKYRAAALYLLPYLTLVVIHSALGSQMDLPTVFADEIGYLGNARYIAGVANLPNLEGTSFHHFGYSLFLVPVFVAMSDPASVYKGAIFVNSLGLSSLFFPLFFLLERFFSVSRAKAALMSTATCLYPAFVLQSNVAWAENAFIPVFALVILMFGLFLRRRSHLSALLFGITASFLYTVHPRGLPIVPIAVLYLLALAVQKVVPLRKALTAISSLAAIFVLTVFANNHLQSLGWAGAGAKSIMTMLSELSTAAGLKNLVFEAAGQAAYLCQATYGLFLIGLVFICARIWRDRSCLQRPSADGARTNLLLFLLLTTLGIFFASCLEMLQGITWGSVVWDVVRADHFVYGRYNEGFLGIYVAVGLLCLYGEDRKRQRTALHPVFVVIVLLILAVLVVAGFDYDLPSFKVTAINILGVYPAVREMGGLHVLAISLVASLLFLALQTLFNRTFIGGISLVVILFSSSTLYTYCFFFLEAQRAVTRTTTLVTHIRDLGKVPNISYDKTFLQPGAFQPLYAYQYLLPHAAFQFFRSGLGEIPKSSIVLSGMMWSDARRLKAEFLAAEDGSDVALWVLPGLSALPCHSKTRLPNKILGIAPVLMVWESGFHRSEVIDGRPVRWTNGSAKLVVPIDPGRPPGTLQMTLQSSGPKGTRLSLAVNSSQLWNAHIASGRWSRTFSISHLSLDNELVIEVNSDTFVPKEAIAGSSDGRRLGVMLEGVRLIRDDYRLTNRPLSHQGFRSLITLGTDMNVFRTSPSHPASVKVSVRNAGNEPWPVLWDAGDVKGSVNLGIRWFIPGSTETALFEDRAILPHTLFPGEQVNIDFVLNPARTGVRPLTEGTYEVWVGPVQEGVAWFYERGDSALKLRVEVVSWMSL